MIADRGRRALAVVAVALIACCATTVATASASSAAAAAVSDGVVEQQSSGGPQVPVNPETDPDEVRRRADEILSGREYQAPEARDRSWFERIREWLGDRFPDVENPDSDGHGAQLLSYGVLVAVLVGAATALFLVLRSSRRRRRAPVEEADVEMEVTPLRSTAEWADEATRCEQDGDHRGAVRARFRGLVTELAERGLVGDTPGRTAGELRGDVAERAPELSGRFDALAGLYEVVWFGRRPADADESSRARDLAGRVIADAPRRYRPARDLVDAP